MIPGAVALSASAVSEQPKTQATVTSKRTITAVPDLTAEPEAR